MDNMYVRQYTLNAGCTQIGYEYKTPIYKVSKVNKLGKVAILID